MTRGARVVLVAMVCALVAVAVALWIAGVRAPAPETLDPAAESAISSGSSAPALLAVEDPVAPPSEHAERTVPAAAADAEATPVSAAARATLAVRVTSVESGAPVANVRVSAREEPAQIWQREMPRTTGEDGLEEFVVASGTEIVVRAGGDRRRSSSAELRVPALAPGERREVAIAVQVEADVVVHGVVLRSDTREGLAGVVVESVPLNPMDSGVRTGTANDGTFRIALRSYATEALTYSHPQFGTARSRVEGHESPADPLVVLLDAGASIVANVIDVDGESTKWWTVAAVELAPPLLGNRPPEFPRVGPPSGLSIRNGGSESSATVSDGSADISGLKAGQPLALEVRRGQRVVWRSREPIVLAPGERRAVAIRVGGASIQGIVRDAEGRPAIGAEVFAHPAGEEQSDYAGPDEVRCVVRSGAGGAYRLADLEPGVWLVGSTSGNELNAFGRRSQSSARAVERLVLHGGPVQHDIVLAGGLTIRGRVLDADGAGVSDAQIVARRSSDPSWSSTMSGSGGAFDLQAPGTGAWTITARTTASGTSNPVVANAGAEEVVLRIAPCANLELELIDEQDQPVAAESVVIVHADGSRGELGMASEKTGFWSAHCLGPGTCHVVATTHGGLHGVRRDLALVAGSTTRSRLVMSPGGSARVRFDGPGDTAALQIFDRGLLIRRATILRGLPIGITGPQGEVELQLTVGGRRYDRQVVLARDPGAEIVFDGAWR